MKPTNLFALILLLSAISFLHAAPQKAAEQQWRLYQKSLKQKQYYNADIYAYGACIIAENLNVAERYCPTALRRIGNWTSASCMTIKIHHRMCEMGSPQACLEAASMNRRGWRGEKEPCMEQEIYGTGEISESRARSYEEKARQLQQ